MVITSTLVHTDLHHAAIKPLPFVYPHVGHLPDPQTFFRVLKHGRRPRAAAPDEKAADSPVTSSTTAAPADADDVDAHVDAHADLSTFAFYRLMFVRFLLEGTEHNMLFSRPPPSSPSSSRGPLGFLGRLGWTVLQGLAIGLVFGFPLWCLAIVILGPIYGTRNMGDVWAPQVRSPSAPAPSPLSRSSDERVRRD